VRFAPPTNNRERFNMSDTIQYRQIVAEARDIAENISTDYDLSQVELHDAIHEICDGHRFVIYTSIAFEVVAATRGSDFGTYEVAEDFAQGIMSERPSIDEIITAMAFEIMSTLVHEEFNKLQEEAA